MMNKVKLLCKYLTKANNNNDVKNVMKKGKQGSYRAELYFKTMIPKLFWHQGPVLWHIIISWTGKGE